MAKKGTAYGTFMNQILNHQNATWQGTINWLEQNKKQPFRSTLELIKLIDGVVEAAAGGEEAAASEEK